MHSDSMILSIDVWMEPNMCSNEPTGCSALKQVWIEYGLRGPCLIAIGVSMSAFMRDTLGNDFLQGRNPLNMLVFSTLNYFARKTLTAVAGTDVMISTFLQSRYWRSRFTAEERSVNEDAGTVSQTFSLLTTFGSLIPLILSPKL